MSVDQEIENIRQALERAEAATEEVLRTRVVPTTPTEEANRGHRLTVCIAREAGLRNKLISQMQIAHMRKTAKTTKQLVIATWLLVVSALLSAAAALLQAWASRHA